MGDKCGSHTFPYIEVKNNSSQVEHEATTSKIGEDQLFYCNQRGIGTRIEDLELRARKISSQLANVVLRVPFEIALAHTYKIVFFLKQTKIFRIILNHHL